MQKNVIECFNVNKHFFLKTPSVQKEVKALNNISLKIKEGKIYGIFGVNGSGKSTLLKLMSKIYKPDSGEIHIQGKIAAILELGTGFHPDLSGKENIYFNANLLGFKKKEIEEEVENIIEFSELREQIDQPIKFYSNGMYMRLAFSIVAHLPCDILLLDEVFSVGDLSFRLKCFKKIKEKNKEGKTILIVSHDLNHIKNLCDECILMNHGNIIYSGNVNEVIDSFVNLYYSEIKHFNTKLGGWTSDEESFPIEKLKITAKNENFKFKMNEKIAFFIEISKRTTLPIKLFLTINFGIDLPGITITSTYHKQKIENIDFNEKGTYIAVCTIPSDILNTGNYIMSILILDNYGNQLLKIPSFLQITIYDDQNKTEDKILNSKFAAPVLVKTDWTITKSE